MLFHSLLSYNVCDARQRCRTYGDVKPDGLVVSGLGVLIGFLAVVLIRAASGSVLSAIVLVRSRAVISAVTGYLDRLSQCRDLDCIVGGIVDLRRTA